MKQKEQWIDEVMNSLKGIEPARASTQLTQRLLATLPQRKPVFRISRSISWLLAASVLLLISLNVATLVHVQQRNNNSIAIASANMLGNEYFAPLGAY